MRSASSVLANLDKKRYDITAIYIGREGRWILPSRPPEVSTDAEAREYVRDQARSFRRGSEVVMPARPADDETLLVFTRGTGGADEDAAAGSVRDLHLDIAFPVLHGPYGEDGTIQGLLELANVPYVGAGVMASAVGMDKSVMKVLFAHPGPADGGVRRPSGDRNGRPAGPSVLRRVCGGFAFPVFVKPANLGSSVGISKAGNRAELEAAIDLAARFDRKVIVEAAVPNAREIEVAVLGNDTPEASVPGEIIPAEGCAFYDYAAKYTKDSGLLVPAPLTPEETAEVRRLAVEAYRAVDAAGLGRVDFLLDRETGAWHVSEINTMPGFTTISMYPRLWEASGLAYDALLDRLIDLGLERHAAKQDLRTSAT